jgi:hypothetical protein
MTRRKRMLADLDQDIRDHLERETPDNIDRVLWPATLIHQGAIMKNAFRILSCLLITIFSYSALAQTRITISQALDYWISNCEKEVVSAADAMPEAKYSYAPTAGEFTGARTFAEQIKRLAANNYRMAARMLGQTPAPDQEAETGPGAVRSKPEILDYLNGSFAALHRSAATITAENAVAPVLPNRLGTARQNTRVQFAVDAVAHSYDHYGQMVEYLRMNGIVPPASRK